MRSIELEDKGSCLNLGSPQPHEIHKARRTTALGKPSVPSKWDDAQKWLVNLSTGPRDSNADDTRLIPPLPHHQDDDDDDELAETKKVIDSICVRDMGTEMTPMPSQDPSRSATPTTPAAPRSPIASIPAARPPPTVIDATTPSFGRQNQNQNQQTNDVVQTNIRKPRPDSNLNPLETRALAWDEAERANYMARFKREEVKIEAWENHEKRKAEMEMKRMEAKAERMKSRAQEKYRNKLASTRRIAEEKRAKAEAVLNEKAVKTCERADYIRRTGHLPSSFSLKLPFSCCW